MAGMPYIERLMMHELEAALADTPVILLHGPRQCGKSRTALSVADGGRFAYITFDDDAEVASALEDGPGYVSRLPDPVILNEVQRVPELFTSIKKSIAEDRRPRRMILTGSANIMLLPRLGDTLTGRIEVIRMRPLAQCEIEGNTDKPLLHRLFDGDDISLPTAKADGPDLIARVLTGGFPEAYHRPTPARRKRWFKNYVETLIQRDLSDISNVRSLESVPKLLSATAAQTACLFNASKLAAPFELTLPTIRSYLALLENIFLIDLLPAWSDNELKRLVLTPKAHLTDSGLAAYLMEETPATIAKNHRPFGQLVETFAVQEFRRLASWGDELFTFSHYRDKDQVEVDLVIESEDSRLVGVEVKSAASVKSSDFRGLRKLQRLYPDRFVAGIVLYDGDRILPFGNGLVAMPFRALWS